MFLAWEECKELEMVVSTFEPWEEQEEGLTKKSVDTLSKVKILIREKKQRCLGEVLVKDLKEERQEHDFLTSKSQKSWMEDGLLSEHERGEQTPTASRPEEAAAWLRKSRGAKPSKIQRLLDFQSELCKSCGLPPSRLMLERKDKKRSKGRLVKRKERRGKLEAGGEKEEVVILSSTPSEVRRPSLPSLAQTMFASSKNNPIMLQWSGKRKVGLQLGLMDGVKEEEAMEPDAGLGCLEEEEE